MPTARPHSAAVARTRSYTCLWSAWLPWLKFIRATSMPAATRSRIFSGVAVAGPRVQTIFARRLTFHSLVPFARSSGPIPKSSDDTV